MVLLQGLHRRNPVRGRRPSRYGRSTDPSRYATHRGTGIKIFPRPTIISRGMLGDGPCGPTDSCSVRGASFGIGTLACLSSDRSASERGYQADMHRLLPLAGQDDLVSGTVYSVTEPRLTRIRIRSCQERRLNIHMPRATHFLDNSKSYQRERSSGIKLYLEVNGRSPTAKC